MDSFLGIDFFWIEKYMAAHIMEQPESFLAVGAWVIVSIVAGWAVFSRQIKDILIERIALVAISLGALSRAFFILDRGTVPLDGIVTSLALAFYALIIVWKNIVLGKRKMRRRSDKTATQVYREQDRESRDNPEPKY